MYGEEAMKAMLEGKIVRSLANDNVYRIGKPTPLDLPTVMIGCQGKWERSLLYLSEWFNMSFEIAPEYDLTFFEAMDAIRDGKKVKSEYFSHIVYFMNDDGNLVYSDWESKLIDVSFSDREIKAMWKVVE